MTQADFENRLPQTVAALLGGCRASRTNSYAQILPSSFFESRILENDLCPDLDRLASAVPGYLARRGLQIARSSDDSDIDYEALVEILMNPDADMPRELMDCLYYVHEMSTPEAMIELLDEIPPGLLTFAAGVEPTPANVAARVG